MYVDWEKKQHKRTKILSLHKVYINKSLKKKSSFSSSYKLNLTDKDNSV